MNKDQDSTEVLFTQLSPGDYYVIEYSDVSISQMLGVFLNSEGRTQLNICAYAERCNGQPRMAAVLNLPRYVRHVTNECTGRRVQAAVRKVAGQ